jgi:amino acid adenylation domain-containing protein
MHLPPDDDRHLSHLLARAAAERPDHPAVEDEQGRSLTYAQLDATAERLAAHLASLGIGPGDRVGLNLPKSLESVAAIHGILRSGAAYVPVDPTAPAIRSAGIHADARVKAVLVAASLVDAYRNAWPGEGEPLPPVLSVHTDAADPWRELGDSGVFTAPARHPDDLAYILYTSGSTGRPKGVMLSHANAFHFIDWCTRHIATQASDRFSAHAPFHFDLSVYDLYAACRAGGTLVLIGESLGKDPAALGAYLRERRISVWYSAPSILALMAQYGGLEASGYTHPRVVLFAGEVFPIRHLKRLRNLWPDSEFWNLYGPTETNVCTAHPIPAVIPDAQDRPYPIGRVCEPYIARVVDAEGRDVAPGAEGELWISGPGVMRGYFARPDLDAGVFVPNPSDPSHPWYRTGDLVTDDDGQGTYTYHGRRDRMVKKRGYRIELGEIESALYRHEDVEKAAVVARTDEAGVAIDAFLAMKPGRKGSIIAMKRHCTAYLPHYMVPDAIKFLPTLPMTSTDKVDYQSLSHRSLEAEV